VYLFRDRLPVGWRTVCILFESTVRIENEWGGDGTGFLVFRNTAEQRGRIFLVTNKHVLNEDPRTRQIAQRLKLFINVKRGDGVVTGDSVELSLNEKGQRIWREHFDANVDVLALDVTRLINSKPEMQRKWVFYSDFITQERIKKNDITVSDEVLIIGYPDPLQTGLAHARTNYPLVRQGIIASRIGEPITKRVEESPGKFGTIEIPGFLVDSTVIHGSSGSPVVLKPVRGLKISDGVNYAQVMPERNAALLEWSQLPS
jgi:hypothetical protein